MMKKFGIFFLVSLILVSAMCSGCGAIRLASELAKLTAASPLPTGHGIFAEATSTPAPSEAPMQVDAGKWDGNTYTNYYTGLTYRLPAGWSRKSQETITEWNGGKVLNFDGSEFVEDLLDNGEVTLMCAEVGDSALLCLTVERLSAAQQAWSDEEFLQQMAEVESKPVDTFEIKDDGTRDTVMLGGAEYHLFTTQAFGTKDGKQIEFAWRIAAVRRMGDILISIHGYLISVPAPMRADVVALLDSFKDEVAPSPSVIPDKLDAGKWTGGIYTNAYTGLTYVLPSGWTRVNDEDLKDINDGKALIFDGTDYIELDEWADGIGAFIVMNKERSVNGYLMFQKISASQTKLSDAEFLKQIMDNYAKSSSGYTNENDPNTETLTLGGAQYQLFFSKETSKKTGEVKWNALMLRRMGDMLIQIVAISPTREGAQSFIDSFV